MYVLTYPFVLLFCICSLLKTESEMPYLLCPLLSKQDQPSGEVEFRAEFRVGQC